MTLQLPQYTGMEYLVLSMVLLPFTILVNSIVFGAMYYSGLALFLNVTLFTALAFVLYFTLCGFIVVLLKDRFPEEVQTGRKLSFIIITLLVENEEKHNILSKSDPLLIDILTTAGNEMVVNHNLHRRTVKTVSNRVGLENIRAKYHLLKKEGFLVMEGDKKYTIDLPLIRNEQKGARPVIKNKIKTI